MFTATHGHHGHPKSNMNLRIGNGLLVALIAAFLLLAGLLGTGTTTFTSQNNDHDQPGFSSFSVKDTRVLRSSTARPQPSFSASADNTPRFQSDIMDSHESVPSLAAQAKSGNAQATPPAVAAAPDRVAPRVADYRGNLTPGVSR